MKQDICKRIKEIRNSLDMNKNEFASFLGITRQYLCTVESGENCLSVEKIILLATKANISTDYILLGRGNIIDENLIKHVLNIDDEQLTSCFSLLRGIIDLIKNFK